MIDGVPMIRHVYENARRSCSVDRLIVATDDERIAAVVEAFGGEVQMTSRDCPTGMDRCAEVSRVLESDIVLDIQGDEPLLEPEVLDRLVESLDEAPWADISTPVRACRSDEEYHDPDCVKAVAAPGGRVLYFSRSPVPHGMDGHLEGVYIHVGIYAFRRSALLELVGRERGRYEVAESLEQLRALEVGMAVRMVSVKGTEAAVDRPKDIERVEEILRLRRMKK
jgi:3-deoxy-manno-octulosonate cytidylyltransferase (CMP-KDO synthetase)